MEMLRVGLGVKFPGREEKKALLELTAKAEPAGCFLSLGTHHSVTRGAGRGSRVMGNPLPHVA